MPEDTLEPQANLYVAADSVESMDESTGVIKGEADDVAHSEAADAITPKSADMMPLEAADVPTPQEVEMLSETVDMPPQAVDMPTPDLGVAFQAADAPPKDAET